MSKWNIVGVGGMGANFINGCLKDQEGFHKGYNFSCLMQHDAGRQVFRGKLDVQPGTDLSEDALDSSSLLSYRELTDHLVDKKVLIVAGLSGQTGGRGAAALVKTLQGSSAALVCAGVMPFSFEGTERAALAEGALRSLASTEAKILVLKNQDLFKAATPNTTFSDAFILVDQAIRNIAESFLNEMTFSSLPKLGSWNFASQACEPEKLAA